MEKNIIKNIREEKRKFLDELDSPKNLLKKYEDEFAEAKRKFGEEKFSYKQSTQFREICERIKDESYRSWSEEEKLKSFYNLIFNNWCYKDMDSFIRMLLECDKIRYAEYKKGFCDLIKAEELYESRKEEINNLKLSIDELQKKIEEMDLRENEVLEEIGFF